MSNSSNLEATLIDGGLTPKAAKAISNALSNQFSARSTTSLSTNDTTPRNKLRMVTREDRRTLFPNLDQPADRPYRQAQNSTRGQYKDREFRHSYDGAQPLVITPTLTQSPVEAGAGLLAEGNVFDNQLVSTVEMNMSAGPGQFLRRATDENRFEPVSLLVDTQAQGVLRAEWQQGPSATTLRLKTVHLFPMDVRLADGSSRSVLCFSRTQPTADKVVNGSGVQFPPIKVPSADPNTLDDYAEATWTPTLSCANSPGDFGWNVLTAQYTKIGRIVMIQIHWRITTSATGVNPGNQTFTLPFSTGAAGSVLYGVTTTPASVTNIVPVTAATAEVTVPTYWDGNTVNNHEYQFAGFYSV